MRVPVSAGAHEVTVDVPRSARAALDEPARLPFLRPFRRASTSRRRARASYSAHVEISGPYDADGRRATRRAASASSSAASRAATDAAQAEGCASDDPRDARAPRVPPARSTDADVAPLLAFYRDGRARRQLRRRHPARAAAPARAARSSCSASSAIRPTPRRAPSTASATSSSRRGCRSSSGAASPTTSCSTPPSAATLRKPARARAAGAAHARRPARRRRSSRTSPAVAVSAQPRRRRARAERSSRTSTTPCGRRCGARPSCSSSSIVREDRSVLELLTRRLHVRQRAARAALRHPERLGQPLPPRARCRPTARAAACSARAAS